MHRATIKSPRDSRTACLLQAVIQDDAEALVWMLKHNLVELEATDDLGNTAAHLAVFHDSPRLIVETPLV